ncbi:twin-arginine translocase TatA/TatE family subunit [Streptomyces sp. ML-6]|uniref:twin-arginine translocase TatA/TatE family subunit n=1 Tax=unclassified Streptomyces TaxID=2593676 RepID=UPI0024BF2A99|nr:twin-arginine translocase TatA/TatE family subunit [Streptomyces sp. ML-6]MDK0523166.1 twin-arginine translocase TatA/TatE family subunit [Streptomyces sp. ML-6]
MFGISELAIILIVVILLLGAKRLPDLARSAGKSARILKAEAKAMKDAPNGDGGSSQPQVIRGEAVDRRDTGGPAPDPGRAPGHG